MVLSYTLTLVVTGDRESGFDSGEVAWETATNPMGCSRRANYPLLVQGGSNEKYQIRTDPAGFGLKELTEGYHKMWSPQTMKV